MIRPAVILGNMGRILLIIGVAMLSCLAWSIAYHENVTSSIALAAFLTIFTGLILVYVCPKKESINFKEGFLLVSLGWIVASTFGSLPFLLSGYLPSFADAWFETVSGFTTTGASVVQDVEVWPRGLLFWRSLTQWLGGMGIIALFLAIIAGMGARANQLFKAEVPGPISDKISPRIRETARKLWITYVIISLTCVITLCALGMDIFDALCHTFTTMATGGFSTKNASIGFYASPLIQWTLTLFMFIAGANFTLHFLAFKKRNPLAYLRDPEFKLYTGIVLLACFFVALSLNSQGIGTGWEETIRLASFQVLSIVTTTGFATADFNIWPNLAVGVLFMMMFVGGCAGSTGGSIKPGRYLIISLSTVNELKKMVHPKAVLPLRFGNRFLKESLLINVLQFFFLYMGFLALGTIVLAALGLDMWSSLTAAAACLGNIGPGFSRVGPTQNFAFIPDSGKYILSILMLVGRLEIYPILVLFLPEFWKE
ncbi:MAG: potassium transporter [Firmicutes bacterium HGW-Firmicutes-15]|nr:MAG: potassium transporter [Firmicutes bacterium HGW-Firmicutes-15]